MYKIYNQFALKAMSKPDFEEVKGYAIGEYFDGLDEDMKRAVATAYSNLSNGNATRSEVALVIFYYTMAEASFRSINPEVGGELISEARDKVMAIPNKQVRAALLEIIDSGRAVSIAEKFYPVRDARSLLIGVCCGILKVREAIDMIEK